MQLLLPLSKRTFPKVSIVFGPDQMPSEIESTIEPGELDTARGHLHALRGQVTLKPKDGVLWA